MRDWPFSFGYHHWQRLLQFSGDVRVSMFHKPLDPASVGPQLERQATAFLADNMLRALQKRDLSMATGKDLAGLLDANRMTSATEKFADKMTSDIIASLSEI